MLLMFLYLSFLMGYLIEEWRLNKGGKKERIKDKE